MSIDPDLRIAIAFILLLRIGIGFFYSRLSPEIGIFPELLRWNAARPWLRWLLWALLSVPLLLFVIDVDLPFRILLSLSSTLAIYSIMWLPGFLRFVLLIPAVAALVLLIWIYHSAVSPAELNADEPAGRRFLSGPFRRVRFPHWLADLLLFGPLLLGIANWLAVVSYLVAILVLHYAYLPRAEVAWQRLLGDEYADYVNRTGALLPRLPGNERQGPANYYSVPKRFGISAIIGLVTLFAVMFGGINLVLQISDFESTPMLHFFFGIQLMAIWIGQMRFGKAPRRASALVGAILLPTFIYFQAGFPRGAPFLLIPLILFVFGGLIGYCLGTMAAALFLFMDWLGPYLPGTPAAGIPADAKTTSPFSDKSGG